MPLGRPIDLVLTRGGLRKGWVGYGSMLLKSRDETLSHNEVDRRDAVDGVLHFLERAR